MPERILMDGKALLEALLALLFFSEILIAGAPQMRSLLRCFSLSQKLEEETRCLSRYRSLVLNLDSDTEFSALSSCADLLETHCASSGMKREYR